MRSVRLPLFLMLCLAAMAAVLAPLGPEDAARVCRDLRCSTAIERGVAWLIEQLPRALDAPALELADVKLLMADPRFDRLMHLARAEALGVADRPGAYDRLAERPGFREHVMLPLE